MTKIAIITTLRHNVGDDFVREGIVHLLGQVLGPLSLRLIHKHLPITVRHEAAWLRSTGLDGQLDRLSPNLGLRLTRRLDAALPVLPTTDKIRGCDVLVQSGAPIYWSNPDGDCAHNEWWDALVERRWVPHAAGRPFLNLAGGTCQRWGSDGSEFAERPEVLAHIRRFADVTALTTLRDELSAKVLALAGRTAEILPCTSIFAVDRLGLIPAAGEHVVLNYMPGGGHYGFGQPIDADLWERRFVDFARRTAARTRCLLVCHDAKELKAARRLLPEIATFCSDDHADYLRIYARARWGLLNRVHGAFALASLGKPAVVVGSDSRAQMAPMIGLRSVFVNEATPEWLAGQAAQLEAETAAFPALMAERKARAQARYLELLRPALCSSLDARG